MATPVGGMTYQDKFEGLFELFEISGFCVVGKTVSETNALKEMTQRLVSKRHSLKDKIEAKLPQVTDLAKKNVNWVDCWS